MIFLIYRNRYFERKCFTTIYFNFFALMQKNNKKNQGYEKMANPINLLTCCAIKLDQLRLKFISKDPSFVRMTGESA